MEAEAQRIYEGLIVANNSSHEADLLSISS
jgi:hypothetical protein